MAVTHQTSGDAASGRDSAAEGGVIVEPGEGVHAEADSHAASGTGDDGLTLLHPDFVKVMRIGWGLRALLAIFAALTVEGAGMLPPGSLLAPVLPLAVYVVIRVPLRRFHARGYRLDPDRLRVVRGVLFRSDTVVPFGRVQHIDAEQGPLERFYGLGTLVLHTAGNHNASVSLPGLAHEDALAMREAIRAHVRREAQ